AAGFQIDRDIGAGQALDRGKIVDRANTAIDENPATPDAFDQRTGRAARAVVDAAAGEQGDTVGESANAGDGPEIADGAGAAGDPDRIVEALDQPAAGVDDGAAGGEFDAIGGTERSLDRAGVADGSGTAGNIDPGRAA